MQRSKAEGATPHARRIRMDFVMLTLGPLRRAAAAALVLACAPSLDSPGDHVRPDTAADAEIRLLLGGDMMTGRGVDQLLPHSVPPQIFERAVRDARHYLALAERRNGSLPGLGPFSYPWDAAVDEISRHAPDPRLVNLETSVTHNDALAAQADPLPRASQQRAGTPGSEDR